MLARTGARRVYRRCGSKQFAQHDVRREETIGTYLRRRQQLGRCYGHAQANVSIAQKTILLAPLTFSTASYGDVLSRLHLRALDWLAVLRAELYL